MTSKRKLFEKQVSDRLDFFRMKKPVKFRVSDNTYITNSKPPRLPGLVLVTEMYIGGGTGYVALIPKSAFEVEWYQRSFYYKKDAIAYACAHPGKDGWRYGRKVLNLKTGDWTYILGPQQCNCSVCGNELEGKKYCPLCGARHHYS